MRRFAILITASVLSPVVWLTAQQSGPPPATPPQLTFRAESNYVEVDAVVVDANGQFAGNLTRDDFEVLEDRKPQDVSVFSMVDIPVEHADRLFYRKTAVDPDVATNEKPFDGRVYMFVLDGLHVAMSRSAEVRKEAQLFIERYMGANDLAAVVHIGDPQSGQEFTANKRLLLASIDRFVGHKLDSATINTLTDARDQSRLGLTSSAVQAATNNAAAGQPVSSGRPGNDTPAGLGAGVQGGASTTPSGAASFIVVVAPPEDQDEQTRAGAAEASLNSVKRLSSAMAGLRGRRKALLLFSEGIDFDTDGVRPQIGLVHDPATDAPAVMQAEHEMMAAATRANVSIYTIDPQRLMSGSEDLAEFGLIPTGTDIPIFDSSVEFRRAQASLRTFAEKTGGFAMLESNDFGAIFDRIVRDNSSYYVLGYHSPDPKLDGRFHSVTVRLKRPGLQVRTREGYYATSDKTVAATDPVREALSSPTQVGGLGMHVSASVLKDVNAQDTVHLTVEFNGHDLSFTRDELAGMFVNDLQVEYQAVDHMGKAPVDARQTMHLRLRPATYAGIEDNGVRFVAEFDVPPGRYQLRFAAHEAVSGHTGSVFYDLDAPDFVVPSLAMSDVLITTSVQSATTGGMAPRAAQLTPATTTTRREWSARETIVASTEVYDNDTVHPHTLDVTATVHADDGSQVFTVEQPHGTQPNGNSKDVYRCAVDVPLKALMPGHYVLTVEARSRLGGPPVTRDVEFLVRQ